MYQSILVDFLLYYIYYFDIPDRTDWFDWLLANLLFQRKNKQLINW